MENETHHKVVCFGEVLWDILPSGPVPGGAPMNVAYHLHKQHKNPAIITSIGNDEEGKQLADVFLKQGVCTDFFQIDKNHSTGKVYAQPNEFNEVVYDIVKPVAWDFISYQQNYEELVKNADYFVYGSLAARSPESKNTLFQLLESANNKVLDINLRPPHYNREIVEELLAKADFLKLNLAELELIMGWFTGNTSTDDGIKLISDKFHIPNMVVTMGGDGAMLYFDGHKYSHDGFKVKVKDTVGSGDTFLAGLLTKLLDKSSPGEALEFASLMGAFIATQNGACPEYDIDKVNLAAVGGLSQI